MPDGNVLEPDRPSMGEANARQLWYPLANIVTPHMRTRGFYPDLYPRGAVIHFTAGRDQTEQQARNSVNNGRENGHAYFVIGPEGEVYQACPLDQWGYHAGETNWPGLGSGVSSRLVGIEITNAGKLTEDRKSWFGVQYPEAQTRTVTLEHGCPPGIYKRYTSEQEVALFQLLIWLKANNPAVFNFNYVLGHHEVAGIKGLGWWRKNDPGGALSMTMDELRQTISDRYDNP